MNEITKICPKCKIEKTMTEFFNNKYRKGGKSCWCKKCKNKQNYKRVKERMQNDPDYRKRLSNYKKIQYRSRYIPHPRKSSVICNILKEHHEKLKDDPEHLSCDFLKKLIGVDCNGSQ